MEVQLVKIFCSRGEDYQLKDLDKKISQYLQLLIDAKKKYQVDVEMASTGGGTCYYTYTVTLM